MTPRQFRTGVTPDISPWLQFTFWQPVLYLDSEESWPSSKERSAYWLGVAENIGDFLTFWIMDAQSKQVLARSVVRPYTQNARVKWDPALQPSQHLKTAHHGGDIKPQSGFVKEKLSNLEDAHDLHDADAYNTFLDDQTFGPSYVPYDKSKPSPGGVLKEASPYLDPESPLFTPVPLKDPYSGSAQLRLANDPLDIDNSIAYYPMLGKERYKDVKYKEKYVPPEQPTLVTVPTKDKQSKPVQDVIPNVRRSNRTIPKVTSPKTIKPMVKEENKLSTSEGNHNVPKLRRSTRKVNVLKTIWKPSKIIKGLALAAFAGVTLVSTAVIAEPPESSLTNPGNDILFRDDMQLQPIQTSETLERLRAYHARLDFLNDIESPEESKPDWQALFISEYKNRPLANGKPNLYFKVQWLNGEKSWVKMQDLRLHDPLLVLRYGLRNKLARKPGWEWVESFVNNDQELSNIIRAYKVSKEVSYKFGVRVPNNAQEALRLDSAEAMKLWTEAIDTELKQINEYQTFRVLEPGELLPPGYKRIPYHLVFDVKFDGRRKCRLVAGGHRTDPPKEDIFSGVVSMEAVRLGFIMARLNGLLVCAGDVGNAFLYGKTNEKVYVIAGPEFGIHEGKRMICRLVLVWSQEFSCPFP